MRMAQSMLQRVARVSGRGYERIPLRCTVYAVKQGGNADNVSYSSLTEVFSAKDVFLLSKSVGKTIGLNENVGLDACLSVRMSAACRCVLPINISKGKDERA